MVAGMRDFIFIYGPPGAGKSTAGRLLAKQLQLPFVDLDAEIESSAGMNIPEIFSKEGEKAFRERERKRLREILAGETGVVALGGGSLLDERNRSEVEAAGRTICLSAPVEALLPRLTGEREVRPLLAGQTAMRLEDLLALRKDHYASFDQRVETSGMALEQVVHAIQVQLGEFVVSGMGRSYSVMVKSGSLESLGELIAARGLGGPMVLVSDENAGEIYADKVKACLCEAGYVIQSTFIPAGEAYKTIDTVQAIWDSFLNAGLDRGSTVIALGGGVIGDLVGFAAATFMRGISWVAVPTSLLAMVDASLGGKTGANLPQGKNLAGAFHAPELVLIDPDLLDTLPEREKRNGLAEVVKHGVIGDSQLYQLCGRGYAAIQETWEEVIRRAVGVKVQIIENDPYEADRRAVLNLGHTIGHALERASGYELRHGEAVAIGLVKETQLAERIGVAEKGLARELESILSRCGLPTKIPAGLDKEAVLKAIQVDKKRRGGKVFMPLPVQVGEVRSRIEVEDIEAALNG